MAWRRRLKVRRGGRPAKVDAKRRQTTRAGRAGEPDKGTSQLRRHKRRLTSRDDVEISGPGILFGHGHLDRQQYDLLDEVTGALRLLAASLGPRQNAIAGLWAAITGASTVAPYAMPTSVKPLADAARRRLARKLERLDGSKDLIVAIASDQPVPLILHAIEGRLDAQDHHDLEKLKGWLDALARRKHR
jgi:hypothetical protein